MPRSNAILLLIRETLVARASVSWRDVAASVSDSASRSACRARARSGFTLIEVLITITIIAVLIGLLMPAINAVRLRAFRTEARQIVSQLAISLETYNNEDRRHRYPYQTELYPEPTLAVPLPFSTRATAGVTKGLLALLQPVGVNTGPRPLDEQGCMLDPWGERYRYQLTRPAPAKPADALKDWNWDTTLNHAKRWNDRNDTPAPFPYVWSLGPGGSTTDASEWIYEKSP